MQGTQANGSSQQARAALVVRVAPGGALELTDEGKTLLNSSQFNACQLLAVSIAGPARSGKSTLLNVLLQRMGYDPSQGSFAVGDTDEDTTKGIWMWSRPLNIAGKQHQLVLLDVEGNNTMQQNANVSEAIYCLAYMISSVLVWNVTRKIDKAFFDSMAHLASATKFIVTDAQKQQQNQEPPPGAAPVDNNQGGGGLDDQADVANVAHMEDIGRCGPGLLVVVRDALRTKHETAFDYLKEQLSLENPERYSKDQLSAIQAARSLFSAHNCVRVPYPQGGSPDEFGSLPDKQLGPIVVAALEEIKHKLQNASVRAINSRPSGPRPTGMLLASFIEKCVDLINARGRLYTPYLYDEAAKHVNLKLVQKAKTEFLGQASSKLSDVQRLLAADGPLTLQHELEVLAEEYVQRFSKEAQGEVAEKEAQKAALHNAFSRYIVCTYNLAETQQKVLQDQQVRNVEQAKADIIAVWTSHARSLVKSELPVCGFRTDARTVEKFNELVAIKLRQLWEDVQKKLEKDKKDGTIFEQMSKHGHLLEEIINQELRICLANQAVLNQQTVNNMASNAYVIKRKNSGNRLHLNVSYELRAREASEGSNVDRDYQHVFVDKEGVPYMNRAYQEGDVVGIYSIVTGRLWKAVATSTVRRGVTVKGPYRILASDAKEFKLGSPVPQACQFKIVTNGDFFCLDSELQDGFITRERAAPGKAPLSLYTLDSRSERSYFKAESSPETVAGFIQSWLMYYLNAANAIVE